MTATIIGLGGYYYHIAISKGEPAQSAKQDKEIAVAMHSFEELPEAEREKYVKKDELDSFGNYLTPKSYAENFDIGTMDEPLADDIGELKTQIRTLKAQNKLLYDDNVDLVAKNLEIAQMLGLQKEDAKQKELGERSKIEELDKRFEDAAAENKNFIERISSLESELEREKKNFDAKIKEKEEKYASDYAALQKSSDENLAELKELSEKLKSENELKNSEIERVKAEVDAQVLSVKNRYEEDVDKLKKLHEKQKFEYENKANEKQTELDRLKSSSDLQISKLEGEMNSLNINLKEAKDAAVAATSKEEKLNELLRDQNITIANLRGELQRQRDGFKKDISKAYELYKNDVTALRIKLEQADADFSSNEKKLSELTALNDEKDKKLKIKDENLSKTADLLRKANESLQSELENGKKNAQNYKILNDKITALTNANITLAKEYQAKTLKLQTELESAVKSAHDLNLSLVRKDEDIRAWSDKFEKLKNESSSAIQNEKNQNAKLLKQNEELDKYAKLGQNNAEIKGELDTARKRLDEMINEKEYFESENENLKKIIQFNFRSEVPKKVVFIASIECDDMAINSNSPTAICRHRVAEFLQRYNSNYIYEIVPIVSRINFIATSKVAKTLPKDELDKITAYANYGVGKERSKVGGELVRDEFGDFSRISYSNDIILSQNKQGFIIKVYR